MYPVIYKKYILEYESETGCIFGTYQNKGGEGLIKVCVLKLKKHLPCSAVELELNFNQELASRLDKNIILANGV